MSAKSSPERNRPPSSASQLATVVVASCDAYADILQPFSALWRTHWPDCPFPVALVTETAPKQQQKLAFNSILACGPGLNWAERLCIALEKIATPYVLLLCDDYFLCDAVDTERIKRRLFQMAQYDAANLRLIPNPPPPHAFARDPDLMEYDNGTAYCIATQAGFWNREFLLSLASGVGSIWEFERLGSFRCTSERRPLLCTLIKEFPFVDAVHKGKWERFGAELCVANGLEIDFSKRGFPSAWRRMVEWTKGAILRINPTLVVKLQNRLGVGHREAKRKR